MRGLELAQLQHQSVVIGVRDLGRVLLVVTTIVMSDLLAQLGDAGARIAARNGHTTAGCRGVLTGRLTFAAGFLRLGLPAHR